MNKGNVDTCRQSPYYNGACAREGSELELNNQVEPERYSRGRPCVEWDVLRDTEKPGNVGKNKGQTKKLKVDQEK